MDNLVGFGISLRKLEGLYMVNSVKEKLFFIFFCMAWNPQNHIRKAELELWKPQDFLLHGGEGGKRDFHFYRLMFFNSETFFFFFPSALASLQRGQKTAKLSFFFSFPFLRPSHSLWPELKHHLKWLPGGNCTSYWCQVGFEINKW